MKSRTSLPRMNMPGWHRIKTPGKNLPVRPSGWILLFTVHCSLFITSCLQAPTYQAQEAIPKNAWTYANKPTFSFDITDTVSSYNLYFLVRHTDAYPYSNIWVRIEIKQPGDSSFLQRSRIEVPLANSFGTWLGRGTGAIWEHRAILRLRNERYLQWKGTGEKDAFDLNFTRAGRYTVRFEQAMRTDPLPEILQVGLRVEKQ